MDKKVIDELPESKDTFWKDAETETIPPRPPRTCSQGKHEFKRIGHEAKCSCGVGYQLGPGTIVEEGHIYLYGKLLV